MGPARWGQIYIRTLWSLNFHEEEEAREKRLLKWADNRGLVVAKLFIISQHVSRKISATDLLIEAENNNAYIASFFFLVLWMSNICSILKRFIGLIFLLIL